MYSMVTGSVTVEYRHHPLPVSLQDKSDSVRLDVLVIDCGSCVVLISIRRPFRATCPLRVQTKVPAGEGGSLCTMHSIIVVLPSLMLFGLSVSAMS